MDENFWKKAFKISSYVLILVPMCPVSVFTEDAQQSKGLTPRAKPCTDSEESEQPRHAPSSSTAPALRASCEAR